MRPEWTLPVRFCGGVEREPGLTVLLPTRNILKHEGSPSILSLIVRGFLSHYPTQFLPHGGRLYCDRDFFLEYTTPEVLDEGDLVRYDYATTRWIQRMLQDPWSYFQDGGRTSAPASDLEKPFQSPLILLEKAEKLGLQHGVGLLVLNSSDSEGNNWGIHENYLIPYHQPSHVRYQDDPFYNLLASLIAIRQAIGESGGIFFAENAWRFVCSQRAEFYGNIFWINAGDQEKPMILIREGQTLGETLADADQFTRIQILSDNNSLPSSLWLKIIFLSLGLPALVEQPERFRPFCLKDPVKSARCVSRQIFEADPLLACDDGTTKPLSWYLTEYITRLHDYYATTGSYHVKGPAGTSIPRMLESLAAVVSHVSRREFEALVGTVDYATLRYSLERFRAHQEGWEDLRARELLYHVVHPAVSGSQRFLEKSLIPYLSLPTDEADLSLLVETPYPESRAYERGMLVKKFFGSERESQPGAVTMSWTQYEYIKDDTRYTIQRKNPWEGSKKDVGELLDRAQTIEEYFHLLSQHGKT